MSSEETYKIKSVIIENVKKIVAAKIAPDGNVVVIGGENGSGKTSVLDSIWWAFKGAGAIQSEPIRRGAESARIKLDLGELVITRRFTAQDSGSFTTAVTVESADGKRKFTSPQALLNSLVGELTFDPLVFARMKPVEQFDALRKFVPDIDFEKIEKEQENDYTARTDVNREAKQIEARLAAFGSFDPVVETVDETALVATLDRAGIANALLEQRKANRQAAQGEIARLQSQARTTRDEADGLREKADLLDDQADKMMERVEVLQKKLDDAGALPDPIDTSLIMKRIEEARAINVQYTRSVEYTALQARHAELIKKSDALTQAMDNRENAKIQAIGEAKLPVRGLGFGKKSILLHGVPFEQGSDAQQLRASIAIAVAMNNRLRVVRVRDGSLLDKNGMKILAEMAEELDFQVWIERVSDSEDDPCSGFVMEDGHIKARKEAA